MNDNGKYRQSGKVSGHFLKIESKNPKDDLHGFDVLHVDQTRAVDTGGIVEVLIEEDKFDEETGRPAYRVATIQARKDCTLHGPLAWKPTTRHKLPPNPNSNMVSVLFLCMTGLSLVCVFSAGDEYSGGVEYFFTLAFIALALFTAWATFWLRIEKKKTDAVVSENPDRIAIYSPIDRWWDKVTS